VLVIAKVLGHLGVQCQRIHGTICAQPAAVFAGREAAALLSALDTPC
jgi:hypothetical protein